MKFVSVQSLSLTVIQSCNFMKKYLKKISICCKKTNHVISTVFLNCNPVRIVTDFELLMGSFKGPFK